MANTPGNERGTPFMWYLIEDFFEQTWILKLITLWGWLSVVIMLTSIFLS